ncbi:MAG TPA: AI-2E family transporter, partial [Paracoccaceae bacterium]|nr:AI-2E family transporter [Paracoccaceae bacterium]
MSEADSRPNPQVEPPRWLAPRWAVVGIFLLMLVAGIAAARDFLMPVLLAFLLALVFTPFRRTLNRVGVPSWACALLVILGLGAAIGVGVTVLSQPITEWAARAPQLGGEIEDKLRSLRQPVQEIAEAGEQIDELTETEA